MEQPTPWVAQLAEGRLEQLDDLYVTVGTVVRRAVYEAIGIAFSTEAEAPQAYEPRSLRYREAFGLDEAPDPDTPPTPDQLAAKRLQRHKHHAGLDSLAAFAKRTRK